MLQGEHIININQCNHWVKLIGDYQNQIPLIIVHGGPGGNHYTFERTSGLELEKTIPVIYYEQRHCGRSDKVDDIRTIQVNQLVNDLEALRLELEIDQFNILGYSFGGELALHYSVTYPKHIHKIILESPSLISLSISNLGQLSGFLSVFNDRNRKLLNDYLLNHDIYQSIEYAWSIANIEETDKLLFHQPNKAVLNRKLWGESGLGNDRTFSNQLVKTINSEQLLEKIEFLDNHTLIITGIFDKNTGIATTELIHSKLKNCQVEYFKESAHFPDIEETTLFVKTINHFLGGSK
ncbi:alpha/beta fold hydrolase [Macrococcoides caseolyticum]|uniref:alpha/beta fold hydrolase n=1 Tax=Macrococcoides caseolyticum TaxID=69966 RepID=UPI001F47F4A3|nr:alpha/beta fold hydrolase [Macrococcus caseolyticus]MCE4956835.1 alpha/beta fold hydrolase [Macrococcus caseolyticus]